MARAEIITCLLFFCWHITNAQVKFSGTIIDTETKQPLAARIKITDDTGGVYHSYYSKLPGFFTEENGSFAVSLPNGKYHVEVFRGIDYVSRPFALDLTKDVDTTIHLQPWFKLKQHGWYNGDGHDHLYTDVRSDTGMLKLVRKICVAQGVDFMFTSQGWAGYNDSTWKEGYSHFSDDRFLLSYGSEMPKYRTGHTWWIGQSTTNGLFEATMDTIYENHYYQSDSGTTWTFDNLPFTNLPDVEVVQRFKRQQQALAIAAHPTSWWMQERGSIEKYVTNVACNLSFGLLSGKLWDGVVAMGYDHDHYYYQNLWFNILNRGYQMPAFSELDGGLGKDDKFYYGSMRTYFKVDGKVSAEKIKAAARQGRSFMTSGPMIFASIDKRFQIGDVIAADGTKRTLNIEAYASGESDDYLSYIIVFRNGRVQRVWDMRGEKKRKANVSLDIKEDRRSWYIVKVYGKRAWSDPKNLDVMAACEKKFAREATQGELDVAFTNPFYFRRKGEKEPSVLMSSVKLRLADSASVENKLSGKIELLVAGKKIKTIGVHSSQIAFIMPVNAVMRILIDGFRPVEKNLYLDYLPHRDLIEELASGRWRERFKEKYSAGEVPWEAFNYDKTKDILKDVEMTINLQSSSVPYSYLMSSLQPRQ
jgi:hypothetical protein